MHSGSTTLDYHAVWRQNKIKFKKIKNCENITFQFLIWHFFLRKFINLHTHMSYENKFLSMNSIAIQNWKTQNSPKIQSLKFQFQFWILIKVVWEIIHKRLMNSKSLRSFPKIKTASEKKHSIEASTSLFKQTEANWKPKLKTNCVFVDFRKAFDAVDRNVLLEKLNHFGIRGILHKLLTTCSSNWSSQYVSTMKSIKRGVPQGSILGPPLFLVFNNDLGAHKHSWKLAEWKYKVR